MSYTALSDSVLEKILKDLNDLRKPHQNMIVLLEEKIQEIEREQDRRRIASKVCNDD